MPRVGRIGRRNARYQQWQALLANRTARHRAGEFLVHGVRPITRLLASAVTCRVLIRPEQVEPSAWARESWEGAPDGVERIEMPADMVADLADRTGEDAAPELVAIAGIPADDLDRLADPCPLIAVLDRPTQPGNIGTLQRSLDAFGGTGLIVAGHAADPYDPKAVRASTGSAFAVPTVRARSAADVLTWVERQRADGLALQVWGTDEGGTSDLGGVPLEGPTILVIGNETRGMSRAWREGCDGVISLPMVGTASSLNAAVAGSIVLHQALVRRLSR
ncbi:MAG: TrmH family RNA methyltransferase [Brachybacterium sp.]|nr:TrmH family RNA methyltransferase [Brachybacterium sp.]